MAEDRELMRAFHVVVEDWHGATDDDRTRALPLFFSTFKLFENAWFQQRQGTLDPQHGKVGTLTSECTITVRG